MATATTTSAMIRSRNLSEEALDLVPIVLATIPNWPMMAVKATAARAAFESGKEEFLGTRYVPRSLPPAS